jgi:hypothetical protein
MYRHKEVPPQLNFCNFLQIAIYKILESCYNSLVN